MTIPTRSDNTPDTGVPSDVLKQVGEASVTVPPGVTVHSRLQKYHVEHRLKALEDGKKLDWATAEALAFGSLLVDGYHVRISGQDVGRGTFSQRHVMLVDQKTERAMVPLNNIQGVSKQSKLEVANSHLSEFAVMGFEAGMSWESPNRLCIWEAQFGDFFNGAQIIIDTFLSSGEAKWFRQSSLMLLLPHGYDGAGPEHSSSRMERFLQLCDSPFDVQAEASHVPNMHVVYPTTPAQYFHLLRRQMIRPYRKPMVVVGPKILLRHPKATSELAEMEPGTSFKPVLDCPTAKSPKRVIFMSGKYYYELAAEREKKKLDEDVAIVRLEELAPFPTADLAAVVEKYKGSATGKFFKN